MCLSQLLDLRNEDAFRDWAGVLVRHAPIATDEERLRNSVHTVVDRRARAGILECRIALSPHLTYPAPSTFDVVVVEHAQKVHIRAGVATTDLAEHGMLVAAGETPRRPHVHDHDVSAHRREVHTIGAVSYTH